MTDINTTTDLPAPEKGSGYFRPQNGTVRKSEE